MENRSLLRDLARSQNLAVGNHDLLHLGTFKWYINVWTSHYQVICDGPLQNNIVQRSSGVVTCLGRFIERVCINEVEAQGASYCALVYPSNHRVFNFAALSTRY